jgi:hypothetical protein
MSYNIAQAQSKSFQNIPGIGLSFPPKNEILVRPLGARIWALLKGIIFLFGIGMAIFLPVYFDAHPFKAGDPFSLLLGIIGSAMMFVGASFYVIRKKVRALNKFGKIKYWLDAHILFCLIGPLLIVYHTAFTISAANSAIAYYSMMIVLGSGVVGRYIYRHFQFSLSGERSNLKEMSEEINRLIEKIKAQLADSQKILDTIDHFFGLRENQSSAGLFRSLYLMLKMDFLEKRLKKQIIKYLKERKYHILEGSLEEMVLKLISLEKKVKLLEVTAKLFSYWHKLHVPFIWILIVTFIIHIAAVMIF